MGDKKNGKMQALSEYDLDNVSGGFGSNNCPIVRYDVVDSEGRVVETYCDILNAEQYIFRQRVSICWRSKDKRKYVEGLSVRRRKDK